MNDTYLPNEVPKKCEFNHILAAKATKCKARAEEEQDTGVTFATVDRQIDRCLSTCRVEVSSPKYNILTAEKTPSVAHTQASIRFRIQSIVTSIQDSSISVVGLKGYISRRMVSHHPVRVVEGRFDLW